MQSCYSWMTWSCARAFSTCPSWTSIRYAAFLRSHLFALTILFFFLSRSLRKPSTSTKRLSNRVRCAQCLSCRCANSAPPVAHLVHRPRPSNRVRHRNGQQLYAPMCVSITFMSIKRRAEIHLKRDSLCLLLLRTRFQTRPQPSNKIKKII